MGDVAISMEDAIARLGSDYESWADTVFPPNLVLLAARTVDPRPFIKGAYWTRAVAAMERARLLPPHCLVIGTLSVFNNRNSRGGDGGGNAEEEEESMQVAVAHLPGVELSTATFERKELRQGSRVGGVCDPYVDGREDANAGAFLVFSVNPQSARELVSAVSSWSANSLEATPAIAGAVLPHADCSNPLILYQINPASYTGESAMGSSRRRGKSAPREKNPKESDNSRHNRQRQRHVFHPRRQNGGSPVKATDVVETSRVPVQFPSNLVLRLTGGRVRLRAWTASGFAPMTPIIRCCDPPIGATSAQAAIYEEVEVYGDLPAVNVDANQVAAASQVDVADVRSLRELVRARLDLSTDQALKIIASRNPNALERFSPSSTSVSSGLNADCSDLVGVEVIDCGYSAVDDVIFSLGERRWERGMFGVVMGRGNEDRRCLEVQRALERARRECETRGELPFGLLVASSILSPHRLSTESNMSSLPLAMMTTELAIGPSADLDHAPVPTVQQNATSGVLLCVAPVRKSIC